MSTPLLLQVSAGTGPEEVRRFVGALGPALEELLGRRGLNVADVATVGKEDAPRSVSLGLGPTSGGGGEDPDEAALSDLLGTHLLVSAERGARARKRWFAHVGLHRLPAAAASGLLDLREVSLSACRAGGPGGQHVNTCSSAVRAVHLPTGLSVRSAGQRSQAANRKAALARLEGLLEEREAAGGRRAQRGRWREHHQLERGRPVLVWTWDHRGVLCPDRPLWGWA